MLVKISIIFRVKYDARTNFCVGFVLPLKDKLSEVDTFLPTSFDAIEKMFTNQTVAKYAHVYMAQLKYSSILLGMFRNQ